MFNNTVDELPGANAIFLNAFNSFSGRNTLELTLLTYSWMVSLPVTLPVFLTLRLTFILSPALYCFLSVPILEYAKLVYDSP